MTIFHLTDEQSLLLDGHLDDDGQAKVNAARARIEARKASVLPDHLAGFVADVVTEARTNGKVVVQHERIRRCPLCGAYKGYAKYKSGPRKGLDNLDRPLYLNGIETARRFVTMKGHVSVGACVDCFEAAEPSIVEALRGVKAEVHERLRHPDEPKRVKHDNRHCTKCGWTGHAGQMRRLPAIMGGTYPGGCPECDAENLPFGRNVIKPADGFTVVTEEADDEEADDE